ncbi:MAG: hypothetical protein P4L45_13720 [Ignavibacteriaceae bacterium]|nr:hypothetical protein [Ignavibacteriaceae bacterium]
MNIGEKIKIFGLENFDTLSEFAKAMEMKFPSLHQYLGPNPRREPGAGVLRKLKALGCDINWLLENDTGTVVHNKKSFSISDKERINKLELEKLTLIKENRRLRNTISNELAVLVKKIKENDGL